LSKENTEVLTTTSSQGNTGVRVCKTDESDKSQKVCMDANEAANKADRADRGKLGEQMLNNETYDLLEQLLIENQSLWRIKNNYRNDAGMDNETKQVWNFIEKDKEELVKILTQKVKERL
jgi:hypothetical protein